MSAISSACHDGISILLSIMSAMPLVVAHRGASHDAPENTQAAFVMAWIQGADAIEGDFRLTKDGHIVCIHDETTGRTANRDLIVARSTLEQLKHLDIGGWKAPRWKGQAIQTLPEVLAHLPEGKRLFLEIKCGTEILKPLNHALEQSPVDAGRVVIQSFDPEVVKQAGPILPGCKRLLLIARTRTGIGKALSPTTHEMLGMLAVSQADGINCSAFGLLSDPGCGPQLLASGKEFHVWTVNHPGKAAALQAMGVSSITTDRPNKLLRTLLLRRKK